jgi:predicted permease
MSTSDESRRMSFRAVDFLDRLRHDGAVAIRTVRRVPTFAVTTIAILGLGVGVSTAMFAIYKTVLIDRLPVTAQDRLVVMHPLDRGGAHLDVPYPYLQTIAADSAMFRGAAGVYHLGPSPVPFLDATNASIVLGAANASPNFFAALGTRPIIGRAFAPDDGRAGAPPVIVLSYAAWQRSFHGDSAVIGRTLLLPYTRQAARIVGVAPAGFEYPSGTDAWIPIPPEFTAQVDIVARLAPGVSIDAARTELLALVRRSNPFAGIPAGPGQPPPPSQLFQISGVEVHSFTDTVLGSSRPAIIALTLAVALLLFIACVNVGNLVLVRLLGRTREIAVRRALGARYTDVARLFFIENTLLGIAGGVVGLIIAVSLLRIVHAAALPQLPRTDALALAGTPAAVAVGITIVSTLLFGLAPSLIASRVSSYAALRSDARTGTEGKSRRNARRWLVSLQVALSVILLTGAALLVRTLERLETMDLGYAPDHVSMLSFTGPKTALATAEKIHEVGKQLVARLEATPGVVAATPIESAPFKGQSFFIMKVAPAEAAPSERDHFPFIPFEFVGPDYFRTFRIPIRRGRAFSAADTKGAEHVVVISEALAHRLWPSGDAIGKHVRQMARDNGVWTVVGVASDTHFRELRNVGPVIYFSWEQVDPFWNGYIAVRTTATLEAALPALRAATHDASPDLTLYDAVTMDKLLDQPLAQPRLSALLMTAFSVVALLLSGIGLYGVMSSAVRRQTRDIGVRVALGATPRAVRRLVLGEAVGVVGVGAVIGIIGAIVAGRLLASQLFGVSPIDPASLVAASVSLLVIGVCAAYFPARRALRIDPVEALRTE